MKSREHYIKRYEDFYNECVQRTEEELEEDGYVRVPEDERTEIWMDKNGNKIYISDCISQNVEEWISTPWQIIGYYIKLHGEDAYKDWKENTSHLATLTKIDEEVERTLKELYNSI